MFPDQANCYARIYAPEHLAAHPKQRVTEMRLSPDVQIAAPLLALHIEVTLRGTPGGAFEFYGYCENEGEATLYCAMEGDAGGFTLTLGMSFENDAGFVTLEHKKGDDRTFLLQPSPCQ